jgi:hypothetical protein
MNRMKEKQRKKEKRSRAWKSHKKEKTMKKWSKAWVWQLQRQREVRQNSGSSWLSCEGARRAPHDCKLAKLQSQQPSASLGFLRICQHAFIIIMHETWDHLIAYCLNCLALSLMRWKQMENTLSMKILDYHESLAHDSTVYSHLKNVTAIVLRSLSLDFCVR